MAPHHRRRHPHPHVDESDGAWSITIDQHGHRPHRIAVGAYDHALDTQPGPDRLTLRDRFELDVPHNNTAKIHTGRRPALIVPNDNDLTYAKVRLDPESWNTALHTLSGIPDALTRAVIWNTARDMVRDGELHPATYLRTARTHLPHETDLALVQGVLTFADTQITRRYTTPDNRPAAHATLTDLCRDLIRRTEDGTNPGLRLTAVRHLIDAATQPDTIQDWLTNDSVPGGPELDPELRWRILTRLAVLGATDETTIATELEHDPSATGQKAPPAAAPPSPPPKPKPPPGTACSTTTPSPTTSSAPPPKASGNPNRPTSSTPTSRATTPKPPHSPPAAAPPSPKPRAATPSPTTPSTPTTSTTANKP